MSETGASCNIFRKNLKISRFFKYMYYFFTLYYFFVILLSLLSCMACNLSRLNYTLICSWKITLLIHKASV